MLFLGEDTFLSLRLIIFLLIKTFYFFNHSHHIFVIRWMMRGEGWLNISRRYWLSLRTKWSVQSTTSRSQEMSPGWGRKGRRREVWRRTGRADWRGTDWRIFFLPRSSPPTGSAWTWPGRTWGSGPGWGEHLEITLLQISRVLLTFFYLSAEIQRKTLRDLQQGTRDREEHWKL